MDATKEQFEAGVKVVQSLAKNGGTFQPSTSMMLTFYALYKQATQGECHTSRPSFYDVVGKAKWDAWKQLGNMPQEEAMKEYVNELKKIVEAMPQTEVVQDFVEKLGNFYEMVDENDAPSYSSPIHKGIEGATHFDDKNHNSLRSNLPQNCRQMVDSALLMNGQGCQNGYIFENGFPKSGQSNGQVWSGVENLKNESKDFHASNNPDNGDDEDYEEEEEEEEEATVNKVISSHGSRETFDEDEFCDSSDVFFHQQQEEEERLQMAPVTSSSVENIPPTRSKVVLTTSVQTEESLLAGYEEGEVLLKVNQAIEEMQRDLVVLKEEVKKIDPLQRAKDRVVAIFDVFRRFNVPTVCFFVLWPVVVGLLFRRFFRSHPRNF